jgi:hypothetical protein
MNTGNSFFDKSVVDAALGDLAIAYKLVSQIEKTSHGNSSTKANASVALTHIEIGFDVLSHYGSPGKSAALKIEIDAAKIIPGT